MEPPISTVPQNCGNRSAYLGPARDQKVVETAPRVARTRGVVLARVRGGGGGTGLAQRDQGTLQPAEGGVDAAYIITRSLKLIGSRTAACFPQALIPWPVPTDDPNHSMAQGKPVKRWALWRFNTLQKGLLWGQRAAGRGKWRGMPRSASAIASRLPPFHPPPWARRDITTVCTRHSPSSFTRRKEAVCSRKLWSGLHTILLAVRKLHPPPPPCPSPPQGRRCPTTPLGDGHQVTPPPPPGGP